MQEEPAIEEGSQTEPALVEDSLIHPRLFAREFLFISCMREVLRPIARECRWSGAGLGMWVQTVA